MAYIEKQRRLYAMLPAGSLFLIFIVFGCQTKSDSPGKQLPASDTGIQRLEAQGLHNLFRVSDRIYSGSSPDGECGFASLAQLGIKTIISVDGGKPDATTAARHGMNYVHLPFGYDGIPRSRVLELAKVAAVRPGPIYVHCHHGLHRGPVAVAVMQLCETPAWNVSTAELWLQQAGTSPQYPGLIHMPQQVVRPTSDELSKVPNDFVSAAPVSDVASLMVEVDSRWDRIKLVKSAGWKVPAGHPDIDPPHEAHQLVEHFREAARLDSVQNRGRDLAQFFRDAEAAVRQLESELRAKPMDTDQVAAAFSRAMAQCAACHNHFRDRPRSP